MNSIRQFVTSNINNTANKIQNILNYYRITNINTSSLGRWNSVIVKPTLEDNKYIDWGNSDHCCYSHNFKRDNINNNINNNNDNN